MGSNTPTYLDDTVILQYERPDFESDISNRRIIEREAANNGVTLRGITITEGNDGTETIRVGLDNVRNNLQSVAAFQRAVSLVFRFKAFQKRAVLQPSSSTTTAHRATADR